MSPASQYVDRSVALYFSLKSNTSVPEKPKYCGHIAWFSSKASVFVGGNIITNTLCSAVVYLHDEYMFCSQ